MANEILDEIMDKLADVYYPVGHYLITSTNTNPNDLGVKGTWELKSKTLKPDLTRVIGVLSGSTPSFAPLFTSVNTTNFASGMAINIYTDGSIPYLSLGAVANSSTTLNDTEVTIGTMNYDVLGSSINAYASYGFGSATRHTDLYMITSQSSSSTDRSSNVNIIDTINYLQNYYASSNIGTEGAIPLHIRTNNGLYYNDELCCQFHWLRTA